MSWPWETRKSTCRNFATISSGLYRFLAIAVLLDVETYFKSDHFVGGVSAAHGVDARKIADDIIASDDKRVAYLIHAGRIANPDIQNWKWRARNKGPDDHAEHLHVSVKSDPTLVDDVSPWPVKASSPSGEIITEPKLKRGDTGDWVRELQRLLGIE